MPENTSEIGKLKSKEQKSPELLRVPVRGGVKEGAAVIRKLQGDGALPINYSITAGAVSGTVDVTVEIPRIDPSLALLNRPITGMGILAKLNLPDEIVDVSPAARRHLRILANPDHTDFGLLSKVLTEIGGHAQDTRNEILKITATPENCETIIAFCRGMPGVTSGGKANTGNKLPG